MDVTADTDEMLTFLHIPKEVLEKLIEADVETANEGMSLGLFSWRPGSGDTAPLRLTLGMGPGDAGQISVKARPPGLRARALRWDLMNTEVLSIELLSDELPEQTDTDGLVEFREDLRDVAVKRCAKLQHLVLRSALRLDA